MTLRTNCRECGNRIERPHQLRFRCDNCQAAAIKEQTIRTRAKRLSSGKEKCKPYTIKRPANLCTHPKCKKDHFKQLMKMQIKNREKPENLTVVRYYR